MACDYFYKVAVSAYAGTNNDLFQIETFLSLEVLFIVTNVSNRTRENICGHLYAN